MKVRRLTKSVLAFRGAAAEFLKGLSSNTTDAPKNAFLDVQGKIIAAFDQIRLPSGDVLAIVESAYVERVAEHLKKYLALSDVRMSAEPSLKVYLDVGGDAGLPPDALVLAEKAGRLIVTSRELESNVSDEEFALFRLRHGIPLQGVDYDREMLLNLGDLSYVSFTKGCFLGQEILARVHHRAKPPKKLVVAKLSDLPPDKAALATSRAKDAASAEYGFVFAENR